MRRCSDQSHLQPVARSGTDVFEQRHCRVQATDRNVHQPVSVIVRDGNTPSQLLVSEWLSGDLRHVFESPVTKLQQLWGLLIGDLPPQFGKSIVKMPIGDEQVEIVVVIHVEECCPETESGTTRAADPERAVAQQRYMKSEMPFRGLSSPGLKAALRPLLGRFLAGLQAVAGERADGQLLSL